MSERCVLVEHLTNINSVIKQPLQLTRRIKYTCFDVSQNYIVFGATSGGLYVFNTNPYAFMKLVPSKEGSVVNVCISSNEKYLAISSTRGFIVIIEDAFTELNPQYQTYTEHEGALVTSMIWNVNELYCGDQNGKVSVITIANSLSRAIFLTPCSTLMKLDSSIVQISTYSKYLLISTLTRTNLCDTEKEYFKQIGKKLRDGSFGACFSRMYAVPSSSPATTTNHRGIFKMSKETEQFASDSNEEQLQIFAARPGSRIWEVGMDASVIRTHQYKNLLKVELSTLVHVKDDSDGHVNITDNSSLNHLMSESPQFGKMLCLANKFILTYSSDGIYIFDCETVALICWSNYFTDMKDLKIVGNCIYLLTDTMKVRIIALYDLEAIVLKTLFAKQYCTCAELCVKYKEDVLNLLEASNRIHLIGILKEKLIEKQAMELLAKIESTLQAISEYSKKKFEIQKLDTGIIVLNNSHLNEAITLHESRKEHNLPALKALKEISSSVTGKLVESTKNLKENLQVLETTVMNLTVGESSSVHQREPVYVKNQSLPPNREVISNEIVEEEDDMKIIQQQFECNQISPNVETSKYLALMNSRNYQDLLQLFSNYMELNENSENWCSMHCLKQLSRRDFRAVIASLEIFSPDFEYILESFIKVNRTPDLICKCSYPLPSARLKTPDCYEIGCELMKKAWNVQSLAARILEEIPYLRKYVLENLQDNNEISVILPLLLQYSDKDLLKQFSCKFSYDVWDNAVQLLIKLKKQTCLNCDNNFQGNDTIPWNVFGGLMVQSMGGPISVQLFTRYSNFVPCEELGAEFFQTCIFATATNYVYEGVNERAVDLVSVIKSDKNSDLEFTNLMAQFFNGKYTKAATANISKGSLSSVESMNAKCLFCDLPIVIPILCDSVKMKCNHMYHSICIRHINNVCIKCTATD